MTFNVAFISSVAVVVLDIDDCASFPCGFDNDCVDKVTRSTAMTVHVQLAMFWTTPARDA